MLAAATEPHVVCSWRPAAAPYPTGGAYPSVSAPNASAANTDRRSVT